MWAHVHPEERPSPKRAPLILQFAVLWLFPRSGTLSAGSTPGWEGELPPAIPVLPHSPQISFLSSPPLLCSAAVDPCHCHGPWPLEFNIPAHPCIYLEFNTQITPLFFIWFSCIELEVNSQGRSKSDLRSPDIPSWACSGISTRLHCINTWKKPQIWLGFVFLCWGGIGRQASDCFSNIWKLLEIKNQITSLEIEGLDFSEVFTGRSHWQQWVRGWPWKMCFMPQWVTLVCASEWDETLATGVARYI